MRRWLVGLVSLGRSLEVIDKSVFAAEWIDIIAAWKNISLVHT
jgi:hypothetical protein